MKSSSHDSISSVFAYHSIILLLVHDIILERTLPFQRRVTSISVANISKLSRWTMRKAVKLY